MPSIDRDQMVEILTRAKSIARDLQENPDPIRKASNDPSIDSAFLAGVIQTYDSMIDLISTPEERTNA